MVAEFTSSLIDAVGGIGAAMVDAFDMIGPVFYNPTTSTLTLPGILIVIALAVGLVKFGLNLILRLFTRIK